MCTAIWVEKVLCENQGELTSAIGGKPVFVMGDEHDDPEMCLCNVDAEKTAEKYGYTCGFDDDHYGDYLFTKQERFAAEQNPSTK